MTSSPPPRSAHRVRGALRFRGFPPEAARFFEALDRQPCPDTMPGGDRLAYAAHVLGPMKDLVSDLESLLSDVSPRLGSEARVGASLYWPDGDHRDPEDCPVREIRIWDAAQPASRSPVLFADFSTHGLEAGVAAAGGDPDATLRVVREVLDPRGDGLRQEALALPARGWSIAGRPSEDRDPADLPAELRPWSLRNGLRISRHLPWEAWIDEPGLVTELADRFRELLPFFDVMRRSPAPSAAPRPARKR